MQTLRLAARYVVGFLGLRREDVILSAFPRSGSTWLRFMLCNLISLREWNGRTVDFEILNDTMVELGVNNLLEEWEHLTLPRIVKTHRNYVPLFGRHLTIGLIRDPRDVMVSYYHYLSDNLDVYSGTFADFIRDPHRGLQSWFQHYDSWRDHWALVVRYEDMKAGTFQEFSRVLASLSVDVPVDVMREAIRCSNIENVRSIEVASGEDLVDPNARFARSGQTAQWTSYFSEEDLHYCFELVNRYGTEVYVQTEA